MYNFKVWFKKQVEKNLNGQGLVEYSLILFLIAVVVIAILVILGPQIGSVFSAVTKGLGGDGS
jgi:pilus assembly protein Flp/PilA